MEVRFWGTRGSIASPGPDTVRYGGNTSCVEVRTTAGTRIVIDGGTGARSAGAALLAESTRTGRPSQGHLLIGHTHWDHIQGLPFFSPLFQDGARWDVYGPRGLGQSIADTLSGQMNYDYFPVTLDQLAAEIDYHDLVAGTFHIDDVTVRARYLNHPALTLGFRLEADGGSVVYLSDHEPCDPGVADGRGLAGSRDDAEHVEFLAGADLVIHDAQYRSDEYPDKVGWGHSTVEYAAAAARLGEARRLVLFHHDPGRTDDELDRIVAGMTGGAEGPRIEGAAEGAVVRLPAARPAHRRAPGAGPSGPAIVEPAQPDPVETVLVCLPDRDVESVVRRVATEIDLEVERLPPMWFGGMDPRTVVVIDRDWPDAPETLAGLHSRCGDAWPAVLAVTRRRPPPGGDSLVSEWVVWPASPAHVRTKLQAAALGRVCRWQNAPLPDDEGHRLDVLGRLRVLDTPAEERFDRITQMARDRLKVPIARVSLVDRERQWFKSNAGDDRAEGPRDESVCAHTILEADVLQVPDLRGDDRFADSPAVTGVDRARFYAGVPLVMPDGSRMGAFCVVDHRPRRLGADQLAELRHLALLARNELLAGS